MDCVLRTYASTLVSDSTAFCQSVLFNNMQISKIKDKDNNNMTDRYLCESLGHYLNLPIYDSYKKICGFVHFSSESFYNIAKASDKSDILLFISRNNRKEDEENYKRIF